MNRKSWPAILQRKYASGKASFVIDVVINGERLCRNFPTRQEAQTFSEQLRAAKAGISVFALSPHIRAQATRCAEKLRPYGASLEEAVDYYIHHYLVFREAPLVADIVDQLVADAAAAGRRERTVMDLQQRLGRFVLAFGKRRLNTITLEELRDWLEKPGRSPRTRIHFFTKISQLYNYAIRRGWGEVNIVKHLSRPATEDKEPGIFTEEQARSLLAHAPRYDLLAYVAIGLFAGLRTAELFRLDWVAVKLSERSIIVGAEVAKKRSRRVVEINDTLHAWLSVCWKPNGPIVGGTKKTKRHRFESLVKNAGIAKWPHNGMRHSFGSYHLALHGDPMKTAVQMGHRSPDIVHAHYKALVLKSDAERFWALLPADPAQPASEGKLVGSASTDVDSSANSEPRITPRTTVARGSTAPSPVATPSGASGCA